MYICRKKGIRPNQMHMERLGKFSELCVAERDCVQFEHPWQYSVEIAGYIKDKYYEIKI